MNEKVFALPHRTLLKPNFWRGVVSAFNLFPTIEHRSIDAPQLDDALALAVDWVAVGKDLENALQAANNEYSQVLETRGTNAELLSYPERHT